MGGFKGFLRDDDGSMAIELVLVTPILVWALLSTYVYFDAFRNEANARRAALTIADVFSREQTSIDASFMDGARSLLRALTQTSVDPDLRVSVYTFDEDAGAYDMIWSRTRNLGKARTNSDLVALDAAGRLPVLADGDRAILVETRTHYSAPFSVGIYEFASVDLQDLTFETFTVVRPRFTMNLCYDNNPSNPGGETC